MDWVSHALPEARAAIADKRFQRDWTRAGDTWFVGVNALENDQAGRIGTGPPLTGAVMDFIAEEFGDFPLDRA